MTRCAVLQWLKQHPHATAEAVHEGVREKYGVISRQAVYDMLSTGTQKGLVRQIRLGGQAARFEIQRGDGHHHLVCRGCGRTEDCDDATGVNSSLRPSDPRQFSIDEVEVVYWGYCQACRLSGAGSHDARPGADR